MFIYYIFNWEDIKCIWNKSCDKRNKLKMRKIYKKDGKKSSH